MSFHSSQLPHLCPLYPCPCSIWVIFFTVLLTSFPYLQGQQVALETWPLGQSILVTVFQLGCWHLILVQSPTLSLLYLMLCRIFLGQQTLRLLWSWDCGYLGVWELLLKVIHALLENTSNKTLPQPSLLPWASPSTNYSWAFVAVCSLASARRIHLLDVCESSFYLDWECLIPKGLNLREPGKGIL